MTAWLAQEGSKRARAAQYGYAVKHLGRWIASEGPLTVNDLTDDRVQGYINMRLSEGVVGETIHGELAALNRALKWALTKKLIPAVPLLPKVDRELRSDPREIEYSPEQVAALLEAAWSRTDRQHVHLFTMISLSTHGRTEAILELHSSQIRLDQGRIHFNQVGRKQTSKKRPIVPIAPSLKPWLEGINGKVIVYRTPIAPKRWADPKVPEFFERPTENIKNGFAGCLEEAGIVDSDGEPWGYPNALRHTIHTYLQSVGVPQAQIDAAAGHSGEQGSGRNYTHLRPEYLREFIEAIEAYWAHMDTLTKAHRRSHVGPKVIDLAPRKRGKVQ